VSENANEPGEMRLAVVADIHANHHALAAVLAAIQVARADLLVCLGDLVGYNAEPSKCLQRIREAAGVVIAGNHDYCTLSQEPDWGTNTAARQAQAWTRLQLDAMELAYLGGLPTHTVDSRGFVAVHGCYLNGTYLTGYVTGTMLEANLEAVAAKDSWPRVAFCGHTHAPLCGWLEGRSKIARVGLAVHVTSGFVHPGVSNHQVLEMTNVSAVPLAIHPGLRICQVVLERTEGEAVYRGRFASQDSP